MKIKVSTQPGDNTHLSHGAVGTILQTNLAVPGRPGPEKWRPDVIKVNRSVMG